MILSMRLSSKINQNNLQLILHLIQRIKHLYLLCFINSKSLPSFIQEPFQKLYNTDPNALPEVLDMGDILLDSALQNLMKFKEHMLKEEKTADIVDKPKFEAYISEIDSVINLYGTVDKDSSQEFKIQVMENIYVSINKMVKMSRGNFE